MPFHLRKLFLKSEGSDAEHSSGCPTRDDGPIVGMRGPSQQPGPNSNADADPIDRALTALRRVEPPAGLEQRVLRNVEARWETQQSAPRAARWRTAFPQVRRRGFIAFASVTALLFIVAAVSYHHHKNAPAVAQTQPSTLSPSRPPESLPAVASTHTLALPPQTHKAARTVSFRMPPEVRPQPQPQPREDFDHPAPELPLTAQERLLLRIACGNLPQQMATNKRLILPARPGDDAPDFDKFFEPYTLPLTEGDPK